MRKQMKWRYASRYLKAVFLAAAAAVVIPGVAMAEDPNLVGRWTFSNMLESTGKWGPLVLVGNAAISDGKLVVSSNPNVSSNPHGTPSGWAYATGYMGPTITDKTLVAWLTVDSITSGLEGSPISIEDANTQPGRHDAIVYGRTPDPERSSYGWSAGTEDRIRPPDYSVFDYFVEDTTVVGQRRQVAISYKGTDGGQQTITGCVNGVQRFQFTTNLHFSTQFSFAPLENNFILFGPQYLEPSSIFISQMPAFGSLDAHIDEARIYDRALSCTEASAAPANAEQCQAGEWTSLFRRDGMPFKNQGDCIQYANTGK